MKILAIGALAAVAACTGVGPLEPDRVEMTLTAENPVLGAIGATTRVQIRFGDGVVPADPQTITWRSSAPSVATVDAQGTVTAVGEGTATITAQTGGLSASTPVTVAARIVNEIRVRSNQIDTNTTNDVISISVTVTAN